jgi:hypothetical protein
LKIVPSPTAEDRKSTENKHQVGQARKQHVNTRKKRQGSTWTQNPNKKK